MMNTFKKALFVLGALLFLSSCTNTRAVNTSASTCVNSEDEPTVDSSTNLAPSIELDSLENSVQFDFKIVETLPVEPNWEDFDALKQLFSTNIPEQFLPFDANRQNYYIHDEIVLTIHKNKTDNTYHIGDVPTALFQKDGLLVVASFYSHNRSLHLDRYDSNGLVSSCEMNADIIGEENCKIIGTTEDFTVVYRLNSQELLCFEGSKIIGKSIKTSPELLEAFWSSPHWNTGFIYQDTLFYPILFKEESGISFQFYEVATNVAHAQGNLFSYAYLHPFSYNIYSNELYIIENAKECLVLYNHEKEQPIAISTLVVNGGNVNTRKQIISYDDLTDIILSYSQDGHVNLSAEIPFLGCQIYGDFLSKYSITQLSKNTYFHEFLLVPYDTSYFFNTWEKAQKMIDFSRKTE